MQLPVGVTPASTGLPPPQMVLSASKSGKSTAPLIFSCPQLFPRALVCTEYFNFFQDRVCYAAPVTVLKKFKVALKPLRRNFLTCKKLHLNMPIFFFNNKSKALCATELGNDLIKRGFTKPQRRITCVADSLI